MLGESNLMVVDVFAQIGSSWHNEGTLARAARSGHRARATLGDSDVSRCHLAFECVVVEPVIGFAIGWRRGGAVLNHAAKGPFVRLSSPFVCPANQAIESMVICPHREEHD